MKSFTLAAVVAAGLSAAVVGLAAPAVAAPTGAGSADETISKLEEGGNRVIVNRLSDTPLSQATVVAVQPGPAIRSTVRDNDSTYQQVITGKIYYVAVR
jgi:hypothetical protein